MYQLPETNGSKLIWLEFSASMFTIARQFYNVRKVSSEQFG